MEVNYKIKENGKPSVAFSKEGLYISFNLLTKEYFNYKKQNLFLHESKLNSNNSNKDRRFTISIRQDGDNKEVKKYKMAQMDLKEDELIVVRNNINKILDDNTYNKKKEENDLPFCNKKYEIVYYKGGKYKNAINGLGQVNCIKGTLINYDNPFTGRFFLENENGALEIIPMVSVVEMREIK
ncbi:TPA: hypothetical protein ACXDAY_002236 [Clostridium botulinum]|uniref:hypothetical protein n=1 Tax=Clostridium botulinum TaxID=1491 RepID=UPI0007736B68|nr:hypothetical protein [Clostridium botulinum]MBN3352059.1 hypothetical protein [Clostridium botulinum]MBN3359200.1 hypothetical protein [Clostridium botulinum]MBN3367273.1 hypothetical protein [Clostridium botulinum]MBN3371657.1 hypothetical protein [Clostridium botulinum]MBN3375537.1 hypothetical protein [Clostridium botulinum]